MPLNGDTLGTNIANAITGMSDADKKDIAKIWKIIGAQIVAHIKTATVAVPAAGLIAPNGPVTGSGTGTIS